MTKTIKRSMSVHSAPVVNVGNGRLRSPTWEEQRDPADPYNGRFPPWNGPWGYKIFRVTNNFDLRPGMLISRDQAKQLVEDGWTVTVLTK